MFKLIFVAAICVVVFATPVPEAEEIVDVTQEKSNNQTEESNRSIDEYLQQYLETNNVSFKLPFTEYTLTLDGRSLESDELDFKLDFSSDNEVEGRKKSKIKKVFIPLLILILLKAIVLIPLALGILAIKTFNALQLAFVSFVLTIVLAIWKLCSKINHDHQPTIIHSAWDPHHHDRSDAAQQLAYSSYAPQQ